MEVYSRVERSVGEGVLVVATGHEDFYRAIPRADPHQVGLGGALISLVEPHDGHERDFNRWYEDDHFYAGAMYMPWLFAGRRYVATRELRELRTPLESALIDPVTAGCYLHLFWIAPGHVDDLARWAQATNEYLRETDGRIHTERSHVFTHFSDYRDGYQAATTSIRDYQLLDADYPGLMMQVIEPAVGRDSTEVSSWICTEYLPWLHSSAPEVVAHSVRFTPRPPPDGKRSAGNQAATSRRPINLVVLLHFLTTDPSAVWSDHLAKAADHLEAADVVQHHLSAPFRPVAFGTDRYIDELR